MLELMLELEKLMAEEPVVNEPAENPEGFAVYGEVEVK